MIAPMPRVRLSSHSRKLDVVIEAVRLGAQDGRLELARGYERRGHVWSDVVLFTREELMERLRRGARVAVGRMKDVPGDFEVLARVGLRRADGSELLAAEAEPALGDQLPAPLF